MMTPKQAKQFIELFREFFRQEAEIKALTTILDAAELSNVAPFKWREGLALLQQQPDYQNFAQKHEHIFAQFEKSADEAEVANLIGTILQNKRPN
jgi:hypothetical protein